MGPPPGKERKEGKELIGRGEFTKGLTSLGDVVPQNGEPLGPGASEDLGVLLLLYERQVLGAVSQAMKIRQALNG